MFVVFAKDGMTGPFEALSGLYQSEDGKVPKDGPRSQLDVHPMEPTSS